MTNFHPFENKLQNSFHFKDDSLPITIYMCAISGQPIHSQYCAKFHLVQLNQINKYFFPPIITSQFAYLVLIIIFFLMDVNTTN